jgi:hypothetical protein
MKPRHDRVNRLFKRRELWRKQKWDTFWRGISDVELQALADGKGDPALIRRAERLQVPDCYRAELDAITAELERAG